MKHVAGFVLAVCWVAAVASPELAARQARSGKDGLYTATQARRGNASYKMRCAACHGATLAGEIGPPLAGASFLDIWGVQPLSELFGKIHSTMPADAPGTLTPVQTADLVAYLLQANRFPAGTIELGTSDAALKQLTLAPPAPRAAAPPTASTTAFPPVGTVNQVMRGILFPSSNVLFDVQTQDPGSGEKAGAHPDLATTTARYGNVYEPWMVVDAAAISIAEVGPILMTGGRRCENGKPAPVGRADWQQYVQGLVEAGRAAYKASQSRNQAAVAEVTNQISDACANCHRVYRDTPTAAMRCQ